jgi:hypothetical protein
VIPLHMHTYIPLGIGCLLSAVVPAFQWAFGMSGLSSANPSTVCSPARMCATLYNIHLSTAARSAQMKKGEAVPLAMANLNYTGRLLGWFYLPAERDAVDVVVAQQVRGSHHKQRAAVPHDAVRVVQPLDEGACRVRSAVTVRVHRDIHLRAAGAAGYGVRWPACTAALLSAHAGSGGHTLI